jgi:hypothetical protein
MGFYVPPPNTIKNKLKIKINEFKWVSKDKANELNMKTGWNMHIGNRYFLKIHILSQKNLCIFILLNPFWVPTISRHYV